MLGRTIFALALLVSFFSLISISFSALTCDECTPDSCLCTADECKTGFFDRFVAFDCTGSAESEEPFTDGTIEWIPGDTGNFYARVYCDNQKQTSCTKITVEEEQITTTTTTTTRSSCPFECCLNEAEYKNRYCGENEECIDRKCVKQTPEIPFNIILIVVIVLIGILIFAYVFVSRGSKQDTFEILKRKWMRR